MSNILLVFTGGTIGSLASAGTIRPCGSARQLLLELLYARQPGYRTVNFDIIEPLQLLSENMSPAAWTVLVEAVLEARAEQYDGVIICHGTDTLAYTAAMLGFCLARCKPPVLLVASDYPLTDPNANGLSNFISAIEYILQIGSSGVFVPYRNLHGMCEVHLGGRLTCSLQLGSDFYSVQGKSLLKFINKQFVAPYPGIAEIAIPHGIGSEAGSCLVAARFCPRLLMIRPYPGLNYLHYDLSQVDVVLHDLYHSGTACVTGQWGEDLSLLAFLRRCQAAGIKVYLAPALYGSDAYESTRALVAEGAEMIWNTSIEAAYIKLLLAYGNFSEDGQRAHFIHSDWVGERVE